MSQIIQTTQNNNQVNEAHYDSSQQQTQIIQELREQLQQFSGHQDQWQNEKKILLDKIVDLEIELKQQINQNYEIMKKLKAFESNTKLEKSKGIRTVHQRVKSDYVLNILHNNNNNLYDLYEQQQTTTAASALSISGSSVSVKKTKKKSTKGHKPLLNKFLEEIDNTSLSENERKIKQKNKGSDSKNSAKQTQVSKQGSSRENTCNNVQQQQQQQQQESVEDKQSYIQQQSIATNNSCQSWHGGFGSFGVSAGTEQVEKAVKLSEHNNNSYQSCQTQINVKTSFNTHKFDNLIQGGYIKITDKLNPLLKKNIVNSGAIVKRKWTTDIKNKNTFTSTTNLNSQETNIKYDTQSSNQEQLKEIEVTYQPRKVESFQSSKVYSRLQKVAVYQNSDMVTGKRMWNPKCSLRGHLDAVRDIVFGDSLSVLASVSEDCSVKVYDINQFASANEQTYLEPYITFREHMGALFSIAASNKQGDLNIYTAGVEGVIRKWRVPQPEKYDQYSKVGHLRYCEGVWAAHTDAIWSLAHHPELNLLISSSSDNSIKLWDTNTEYLEQQNRLSQCYHYQYKEFQDTPTSICWRASDNILSGYSQSNYIVLYDLQKDNPLSVFKAENDSYGPDSQPNKVIYSPGNQMIIGGYEDKLIRFFDINSGKLIKNLVGHADSVTGLTINDNYITSVGHDGSLRTWDIRQFHCVNEIPTSHRKKYNETVFCLANNKKGQYIATGGADGFIKIFQNPDKIQKISKQ